MFRLVRKLGLCLVPLTLAAMACTPNQYASQADDSAYKALGSSWDAAELPQGRFGIQYDPYKAAYTATQPGSQPAIGPTSKPSSQPGGFPSIIIGTKVIPVGGGNTVPLTAEEAQAIAFRNSRQLQSQKEDLYIKALGVASATRGWDFPVPGGAITGKASISKTDGQPRDAAGAISANPTITQRFRQGGVLALGTALNLATDFTGGDGTTVGSLLSANFTQPLLQGAWHDFAYEPIYRMERDLLFATYEYDRYTQTFATEVFAKYYGVLAQRDALENDSANIERLQETFALTKVQAAAGEVSRIQQDQAEQNLLDAQINYQDAQRAYRNSLDQFKIFLGLPVQANLELDYPGAFERLNEAGPQELKVQEEQAVEIAFHTRPDVLSAASKVRDANRDVELAANKFLPQLDVQVGVTVPSTPPNQFTRMRFDKNTRYANVVFDYPIDQTDHRDAYRLSLINRQRAERDFAAFLDNVRLSVRESYRTLVVSRRTYDIQLRNVETAKRRRKLASLQQKEGQASARDVLEAEEALRKAQNGLTQSLVAYTTTRLNFLGSLGMLSVDEEGQIHERTQPFRFDPIERLYPYVRQP